ncbi:hypothetical protein DJ030_09455 [bacterium endosymbiont of Escarpia laminata]|nr:MAG: hypothetical protein DJ030_09455 [bacterium endosymbiont of Escarpia laminata]
MAKQALSDVVEEVASASLEGVIEQVSGATVPGLGLIVKLGRWGIGKTKTSRETKKKLLAGGNRDDLLEDIVVTVAKMARPRLSTVVFVEDFHKATTLMEELVERLVRTNAALLIITTSWPSELGLGRTPQKLFVDDFLKSRILRIQTGAKLPELFHSGASMDELPTQALRKIILSYYPHTDEETLEQLASRYNNPLPLELVCTMPVYQDNFAANGRADRGRRPLSRIVESPAERGATRHNNASLLRESGQVETALEQFNVLLTEQIRILGEKHPDTIDTLQAIDYLDGRLAGSKDQEDGPNNSAQ